MSHDEDRYLRFRAEVRDFLRREFTDDMRRRIAEGAERVDLGYHRALMATGWFTGWFTGPDAHPDDPGGDRPGDPGDRFVRLQALWDEATAVGAPIDYLAPTLLVGSALQRMAEEDLRAEIVSGILGGQVHIALGFSEPGTGSDLAAVRTRAVRTAEGWRITGEKTWTTNADLATHIYLLARTDPDAAKHSGLTVFLVPMHSAGIHRTPIRTLADHPVYQTFFDDVVVPDRYRVGAVNGGWSAMRTTLAFEHGVPRQEFLAPLYDAVLPWAQSRDPADPAGRPIDDPQVRTVIADVAVDREIAALMRRRQFRTIVSGGTPGPEANMYKLFHAEAYTRAAAALLALQGLAGCLEYGDESVVTEGAMARAVRTAQMMTIAGGTSEIHRDVIAQRLLGLPSGR